ncbi:MAG TPA: hypothetical protein VMA36_09215 [Candidatus Limnocylindria bacterium]|jgi:hypothetical protein|nr:hypothetical protein [Candidatus Limnocylindria bacterium]
MAHGPKAAFVAAALFVASIAAASAAAEPRTWYFLINGPDFRQVSASEFAHMRESCMRVERKSYPDDNVVEWHCYL